MCILPQRHEVPTSGDLSPEASILKRSGARSFGAMFEGAIHRASAFEGLGFGTVRKLLDTL